MWNHLELIVMVPYTGIFMAHVCTKKTQDPLWIRKKSNYYFYFIFELYSCDHIQFGRDCAYLMCVLAVIATILIKILEELKYLLSYFYSKMNP